ncbi:MAG: hypothetical protein NT027_05195 [Proteobacteria bacterium]|nr:hypothetical protein [Pseudomonadota bacterium]
MGLLDILKGKFWGENSIQIGTSSHQHTRRAQVRFQMNNSKFCFLETPTGTKYVVKDLSYMACYVEPMQESNESLMAENASVKIYLFGTKIGLPISNLKKRGMGWVVSFTHKDEQFFLQLASVLEPLRFGNTSVEMANDPSKSAASSELIRKRYIGEGPFDLVCERDASDKIVFAMVTMRRAEVYFSVLLENGHVITKQNVDSRGVGARMAQTAEPDSKLVYAAAAGCFGVSNRDGRDVSSLLHDWLVQNGMLG